MVKNFKILDGPESIQGSPEWKKFRKGKITASMCGSIMGVDPWRTPLQLFNEWVLGEEKIQTEAMRRGNQLEPLARDLLNIQKGRNYVPVVVQSLINPLFMVSLDGFWIDEKGHPHIIEIKCPGEKTHAKAIKGKVEEHYYLQMQMQMDVVGIDEMIYVSFNGEEIVTVDIKRDPSICTQLYEAQIKFLDSIKEFRPPEPTDEDWVENKDPNLSVLAIECKNLSEQEKLIKKKRDELKEQMQPYLTNTRMKSGEIKIQKVEIPGRIDYSQIPELNGVDLEKYRGPTVVSWRIH